jgi:hypothetical protein
MAVQNVPTSASHDDLLFTAMLLTGFYGLMRLGELTMPEKKAVQNWRKLSRRDSLQWSNGTQGYSFLLPAHKADTTFEGNKIIIVHKNHADPVPWMRRYVASRDNLFPIHPLLWVRKNGKMPQRSWFLRRLRKLFPDPNVAGQSLRSGGATALAEDGVAPHLIQACGRWSSDAFKIYIRKHAFVLTAMLHPNNPTNPPANLPH